jgi:tetratricopeptide (TPR) repeat protein
MKRAVLALLLLFALPARADSIWDKAKTPPAKGLLNNDDAHRLAAIALHKARTAKATDPIFGGQTQAALWPVADMLRRQGAPTSSDPRLRYDLGLVLAKVRDCKNAVVVLEDALKFAKSHPFAEDGAFELAICYSLLGKHADEERAYGIALESTDRAMHKSVIYSNLSESRMAQGKLKEGIEAAEAAIDLEPDFASARYNLAILKDRVGDAFGALDAAKHAVAMDPEGEYLDGDGVFFEPPYERQWYYALRSLALADQTLGDERTGHLMAALVAYRKWLDASEPTDRFRPRCVEDIARLETILKLKKKP